MYEYDKEEFNMPEDNEPTVTKAIADVAKACVGIGGETQAPPVPTSDILKGIRPEDVKSFYGCEGGTKIIFKEKSPGVWHGPKGEHTVVVGASPAEVGKALS